jgi:polyphosphate kinase
MTTDTAIGKDVSELFNYLTGYSGQKEWRKLIVAPINLRDGLTKMIQNCINNHTESKPSLIRIAVNQLVDPQMIQALYKASIKGVKVELIVRGVCCLKPKWPGVADNIIVRSVVGRFLEHPRVFAFYFNGKRKIYLGSADLMQRNLNRRVETMFPVEDSDHQDRIHEILETLMNDNVKARELNADGSYSRVEKKSSAKAVNAQVIFLNQANNRNELVDTIS